ncbi:MAG: F0F1 ATP synthase subunit A [Bacteroidota bacterium]
MRLFLILVVSLLYVSSPAFAGGEKDGSGDGKPYPYTCKEDDTPQFNDDGTVEAYDPAAVALHHIGDANAWHFNLPIIGDFYVSLPVILYAKDAGPNVFMSGKFDIAKGGNGRKAIDRYIMYHGVIMRITDESFPMGVVELDCPAYKYKAIYQGMAYPAHDRSVLDGGVVAHGITTYYDFSITKNVVTLILTFAFLAWVFMSVAKSYKKYDMHAPKGFWQRIIEPIYLFMRDEVCKPVIGPKYEKHLPFIMSLFFFILALNLIGQIPFIGNPNVSGNISFTMALALFTLVITSINGNRDYWQHIFNMPGVPGPVKIILTPIEVLGIFLKPITLMVRLFANITAGHIMILSAVGMIFIFGNIAENDWGMGYATGGGVGLLVASILTLFLSAIEVLVAFLQAFIFAVFSASYIGAAIEEHHH